MRPLSFLCTVIALLLVATMPSRASDDGLTELARIQTGLNRVAAGLPPETGSSEPFERLVAAFSAGWASPGANPARAEPILQEIEGEIARRSGNPRLDLGSYIADLKAITAASGDPLVRLIAALHCVDAILIAETVKPFGFNYHKRDYVPSQSQGGRAIGAWLRLPCRALLGREDAFRQAIAALGELADPVLDCPPIEQAPADLNALTRFALDPAAEAGAVARRPKPEPVLPAKPAPALSSPEGAWDHETAVAFMASDPDRAEAVLEQAVTPLQKIDYALFLFTFRPASPERDARIGRVFAEAASTTVVPVAQEGGPMPPFDGSARSVIDDLVWFSMNTGVAPIPCAVLIRAPALIKALETQFGGRRDSGLPQSGCAEGRGSAPGFPEAEVRAFEKAAVAPTHEWLENFEGSLVYTIIQDLRMRFEIMRLDPRAVLNSTTQVAAVAPPYLVWSYLTLDNRRIQATTQAAFERAEGPLATYYQSNGLDAAEAKRAADAGLRSLAYGNDCGGTDALPSSFRTLLLDGAPLERIEEFAASGMWRDPAATAAFRVCAQFAGMDPLAHVAVARPNVLPFLWDLAAREPGAAAQIDLDLALGPEARNAFGKTPLMAAAQLDQPDSMRLLLARNANPNARTDATGTAWARRTPLMYAAASASLPTIKLLLKAGADPQAADSKGSRALHYLLGFGPVSVNPRLSAEDLAEAARLLY